MIEDKDILEIYKEEGKREYAFNLLTSKYSERLYWHIRKLVGSHEQANDLLQETLIKVWKYLPNFREESKLYTWLYRIATNETLTFLKKEKVRNFLSFSSEANLENKLSSDTFFNGDQLQLQLYKAINSLPSKQKVVFNLRYFDEMKYEDIANILGGTVGSLKASYHHAYTKVEKIIKELN